MAVDTAYNDILAVSATLEAVSQLPVPLGNNTEGYEVMHSAHLSLDVRDEVSQLNYATHHGHAQSSSISFKVLPNWRCHKILSMCICIHFLDEQNL